MADTSEAGAQKAVPENLPPSKLGTKDYWDKLYDNEIANHVSNPEDTGTVWFDDSDAEAKMVAFLNRTASVAASPMLRLDRSSASFLDLGTGNGSMLHALRRAGWAGRCLGVDYSAAAVTLARQIAESDSLGGEDESDDDDDDQDAAVNSSKAPIEFAQWDVLAGPLDTASAGTWDVVLDKGTFDAVCLSDEVDADGRMPSELYRDRVLQLLKPGDGGLFLVTSCNWTDAELRAWFEGAGRPRKEEGEEKGDAVAANARFEYVDQVEYRSFSFGGVKGQTISTVCFVKKQQP